MNLRTTLSLAALAMLGTAQAATSIYFGDANGNAITSLSAPAVGFTFTLSVYLTSTDALSDGEILVSFDQANSMGPTASPTGGLVTFGGTTAVTSVSPASGFTATGPMTAGGGVGTGSGDTTNTSARGYGIDIPSFSRTDATSFGSTSPTLLFNVTLKNQGLTAGKSQAISFYESGTNRYRTSLVGPAPTFPSIVPSVGTVTVTAAAVPEPTTLAALGFGALAMLRRRKRA